MGGRGEGCIHLIWIVRARQTKRPSWAQTTINVASRRRRIMKENRKKGKGRKMEGKTGRRKRGRTRRGEGNRSSCMPGTREDPGRRSFAS
jgi:hypothetical protein